MEQKESKRLRWDLRPKECGIAFCFQKYKGYDVTFQKCGADCPLDGGSWFWGLDGMAVGWVVF